MPEQPRRSARLEAQNSPQESNEISGSHTPAYIGNIASTQPLQNSAPPVMPNLNNSDLVSLMTTMMRQLLREERENSPAQSTNAYSETISQVRPRQPSCVPREPTPSVGPSEHRDKRVNYPRQFADNNGDINYDAWKMEMMIMLDDNDHHFDTVDKQIRAYFTCTTGRAQELLLTGMQGANRWEDTGAVVRALDEEFFDYNKETKAREDYYKLMMDMSQTYQQFRVVFRKLAMTGQIGRERWFDDLCQKITPGLRRQVVGEKFRMQGNYTALDEYLQYLDRENVAIRADPRNKPSHRTEQTDPHFHEKYRAGLANKGSLPHRDRVPGHHGGPSSDSSTYSRTLAPTSLSIHKPLVPGTLPVCYHCNKPGHYKTDCPDMINAKAINNMDASMVEEDDLSENF